MLCFVCTQTCAWFPVIQPLLYLAVLLLLVLIHGAAWLWNVHIGCPSMRLGRYLSGDFRKTPCAIACFQTLRTVLFADLRTLCSVILLSCTTLCLCPI